MSMRRVAKYATLSIALIGFFLAGTVAGQREIFPASHIKRVAEKVFGRPIRENQNRNILNALYKNSLVSGTLFIGDSHVQYGDWVHLSGRMDVYGQGVAGETSQQILDRIKLLNASLDTIVVLAGTNDIDDFSRERLVKTFAEIKKSAKSKASSLVVVAPPLTRDVKRNAILGQIIEIEKGVCSDSGCKFVDCNDVLAPGGVRRPETAVDAIHLSVGGYHELFACLRPQLFP